MVEQEFINALQDIAGKFNWATTAVGTWIHLNIGEKLKRANPESNPYLPNDLRIYRPAITLDIFCPWILYENGKVVCRSVDCLYEDDAAIVARLRDITNQTIKGVKIISDQYDLTLEFENGFSLTLLPEYTAQPDDDGYNYTIFYPDKSYTLWVDREISKNVFGKPE